MAVEAFSVSHVDAFYGDSHVLHDVSFSLGEGRLLGLLGRNGAGKSTCMNAAAGLVPIRRGQITVFGRDITRLQPEDVSANRIALVPQGRRIFKSLSVRENLAVAARAASVGQPGMVWTLDAVFATFPRLKERQNQTSGTLSGGEQQMLAIGRALMTNPRVLLMDEPSEGLAPNIVTEVIGVVRRLRREGLSIILVEQNVKLAFEIADDVVILNNGRVALAGDATTLKETVNLKQHLGIY